MTEWIKTPKVLVWRDDGEKESAAECRERHKNYLVRLMLEKRDKLLAQVKAEHALLETLLTSKPSKYMVARHLYLQ